jgi:arylsulfatase A-like enzyme
MVRSRDYKYLCFNSGKRPEMLFDLRTDSAEQHNLALKADGAVALKQHRNMLRRWQDSSADDFVLSQAGS